MQKIKESSTLPFFCQISKCILNFEKYFNIKKGMARTVCNKMEKIWRSHHDRTIKIESSEPPLNLYYSTALKFEPLSAKQQRHLDRCYTYLLRREKSVLEEISNFGSYRWRLTQNIKLSQKKMRPVRVALCASQGRTCIIFRPLKVSIFTQTV